MDDDTWHLVKHTSKVTGFVGGAKNRPAPISEAEVMKIVNQMQEGVEKPRPKVEWIVGELVRVKEGPFTDFNGAVEEVNYEKSKVRVSVTIFGRATPVELDFAQVEKDLSESDSRAAGRALSRLGARPRAVSREPVTAEEPAVVEPRRLHSQGEQVMAKKIVGFIKLQVPAGKANPSPPDRPGAGPARPEHHGVLQGVQRPDPGHRAGPAAAGGDHRVRGQVVHLRASRRRPATGADQEGDQARQGLGQAAHSTRSARSPARSSKRSPRPR